MCTVSWLVNTGGYQIFFNRDEQRNRGQALAPQGFQEQDTNVLMPIDPDGGGSWISVNDHGLSLCLLNFYQGQLPEGALKSRGQLLKSLSSLKTQHDIAATLNNTNLFQYASFTLLSFTSDQQPQGFQWDGKLLKKLSIKSPMTSSSVAFDSVSTARQESYERLGQAPNADQLLMFHQGHQAIMQTMNQTISHSLSNKYQSVKNGQAIQGEQSVCMHRDDAKTVSFSHIEVTDEKATFSYLDGSPCGQQLISIDALKDITIQSILNRVQTRFNPVLSDQQKAVGLEL